MTFGELVTFDSYRDFKGYVINLDREHWRYAASRKNLTTLGFSNIIRWKATDYREEDVNTEIRSMGAQRLERFINDAEIALVLSHCRIWAHFLSGNDPYCLVFEDDVVGIPEFGKFADFADLKYGDFDILSFGGIFLDLTDMQGTRSFTDLTTVKKIQGSASYISGVSFWQSHAYMLSREGAYKALLNYSSWMSLDEYRQPQVDNYISNFRGLKVMLAANQDVGDSKGYSLANHTHHIYGDLSNRVCGILLQEKAFRSTIQNP